MHWRVQLRTRSTKKPYYLFACSCGKDLAGERHSQGMFITCPLCQQRHWIMPYGAWYEELVVQSEENRYRAVVQRESRKYALQWLCMISGMFILVVLVAAVFIGQQILHMSEAECWNLSEQYQRRFWAATQKGQWDRAKLALADSVKAIQNSYDSRSAQYRKLAVELSHQLELIVRLSEAPLETLLQEAHAIPRNAWSEHWNTKRKGSVILLELPILADTETNEEYVRVWKWSDGLNLKWRVDSIKHPMPDPKKHVSKQIRFCAIDGITLEQVGNEKPYWQISLNENMSLWLMDDRLLSWWQFALKKNQDKMAEQVTHLQTRASQVSRQWTKSSYIEYWQEDTGEYVNNAIIYTIGNLARIETAHFQILKLKQSK